MAAVIQLLPTDDPVPPTKRALPCIRLVLERLPAQDQGNRDVKGLGSGTRLFGLSEIEAETRGMQGFEGISRKANRWRIRMCNLCVVSI